MPAKSPKATKRTSKKRGTFGAHMSIAGGVHLALERGLDIGCDAIQLFVKSSNQWRAKKLTEEEITLFHEKKKALCPTCVLAHTSYLLNLASPERALLEKSRASMLEEMQRCDLLGIPYLILHPGSHRGAGEKAGIESIAESLNGLFAETAGSGIMVLVETTAGQGNTLGHSFEQLADIIARIDDRERIGVCFDTCHSFTAGYDIRTKKAYERTFAAFESIIGLEQLKAFHLNDSLKPLGSRRDRHTHIGTGEIGLGGFRLLVNDKRFSGIPMVLETPKGPDLAEDIENLKVLRGLLR
jgi:deoxyribonuclease-4